MVDMGDDGDISELADHEEFCNRGGRMCLKGQRLYRSGES
jgi:hypothetical protein